MKKVAVCNQKGGVGKTATAVNLSSALAHLGKKILLVDIDPQANATRGIGVEWKNLKSSIYELLLDSNPEGDAIIKTKIENLSLIPAHPDLVGAQLELYERENPESHLSNVLNRLGQFDYCLIDCPPALGILTINALAAADSVLIPIQCEYYALEGIEKLLTTIRTIQEKINPDLTIEGVILTMFDKRLNLAHEVVRSVKEFFGDRVYNIIIPRNVRIAEAPGFGKSIFEYDKHAVGARAYLLLAEEFLNHAQTR
ncbi:MAG TPA: ParA family protein [bacterium (Candidatus Stahlbacteria)]|nr:ParA family protein [Candidatus Stahlbacteria bacterium]